MQVLCKKKEKSILKVIKQNRLQATLKLSYIKRSN